MSLMLYQCPCGRQYNADRINICPACRLPFGQDPSPGFAASSELTSNAELLQGREVLHESINQNAVVESSAPAAGWYPDPNGLPSDRYWDGSSWTESTRPQTPRPQVTTAQRFVPAPGRYSSGTQRNRYGQPAKYPNRPPENGFGTAALVLGIVGLFTPLLAPTLAVVFGWIGLNKCNRGEATNRTMAVWGLSLGWVAWAFWVIWWFIVFNS